MSLPVHGLDGHAVERFALRVDDPSPDQVAGTQPELDGFHPRGDDHVGQLRRTAGRLGGHRLRAGRHVIEPEAALGIRRDAGEVAVPDPAIRPQPDLRTGERPALIVDHPPRERDPFIQDRSRPSSP